VNNLLPISSQTTTNGQLTIGTISVETLATTYGTPLYVLDHATIAHQVTLYQQGLAEVAPNYLISYACKANLTTGLAHQLNNLGVGFDVVSSGELKTVLKAGVISNNIVFHGNNKLKSELTLAIENNIRIVVDNQNELEKIHKICISLQKKASILLRLKPGVDTNTHAYIKTGQADSKFGIDDIYLDEIAEYIRAHSTLNFLGIHAHIGSQITELPPYLELVDVMSRYLKKFQFNYQLPVKELDLGGGFGVAYTKSDAIPNITDYLQKMVSKLILKCKETQVELPKIIVEPGRSLIAQSGVTLYRVGTIKEIPNIKTFVFVDGGMADNMRPALYQSKYTFEVGNRMTTPKTKTYSIAGKYCETGDILAENVPLPEISQEDIIVVAVTGAYNYAMASTYNRVGRPAMIMIKDGQVIELLKRETDEDLLRLDTGN
jgi:diaminopimelate decarboxylase